MSKKIQSFLMALTIVCGWNAVADSDQDSFLKSMTGHWLGQGRKTDAATGITLAVQEDTQSSFQTIGLGDNSRNVLLSQNVLSSGAAKSQIIYWIAPRKGQIGIYDIGNNQSLDVLATGTLTHDGIFQTEQTQDLSGQKLDLKSQLLINAVKGTSHYQETVTENGKLSTSMTIDFVRQP